MDQRRLPAGPTERDMALWFTERIVETLRARRFDELQPVARPFPPALGAGEVMLAEGPFELSTFRPVGDGSYVQRSTAVLPIGRGGLGLAAGVLVAQGVANRRRRAAAAAAATPRWVVDDGGTLWVATHGFYLQTARGLYPWPWQSIAAAELVGPGQVHLQGTSEVGRCRGSSPRSGPSCSSRCGRWFGTPVIRSSSPGRGLRVGPRLPSGTAQTTSFDG